MTLSYLYQEGVPACSREPLKVAIDGKVVGKIHKVEGGFQYFPEGQKIGREVFETVALVQKSLN